MKSANMGALALGVAAFAWCATGATYHLATDGSDLADGAEWETAVRTPECALSLATSGDHVLVAPGTYTVTSEWLRIDQAITLRSAAGPEATVFEAAYVTNSRRRVMQVDNPYALVSGFTLRGGSYQVTDNTPSGLHLIAGVVSNCIIRNNSAYVAGGVRQAGGILTDCIIKENVLTAPNALGAGAGLYLTGGVARRCLIESNLCNKGGAST